MSKTSQQSQPAMPGSFLGSEAMPEVVMYEQPRHQESPPVTPEVFPTPQNVIELQPERLVRGGLPLANVGSEVPSLDPSVLVAKRALHVSGVITGLRHQAVQYRIHEQGLKDVA